MKRVVHAAAWVLLAVTAFLLWPKAWGGSMTYVVTSGTSMQPAFEAGDLAILRSASDYGPGDVAAYDSSELQKIVMHRITEESEQGYALQGDNNDFRDPETVTDEQMLGRLVLRVPGLGNYLGWLLQPLNLLVAAAALFFLFGDRKKDAGPASGAPVGRVRVASLHLPPAAVTAELSGEDDLERLAAHYDRPILEVEGDERGYVLDGSVVYTWKKAAARPNERRRTPQGRDWAYGGCHLQPVPATPDGDDVARVS